MGQNFVSCDRDQVLLLPPSLMDWLAEDHLVWSVLGAVDRMDLAGFYGVYRANGQGRAAYDPAMMVALLLYAYCVGVRSSRQIERACRGDVAFMVICAMQAPDHCTIAEFRRRHQDAIGELFVEVLGLCAEAGLVELGEIAVDSTKMHASASYDRNRGYASIVEEILDEAEQADRAEDERFGQARGDEVPEQLRTREGRRAALDAARERIQAEREARQEAGEEVVAEVELELVPDRFVTRPEGRKAWLRQGRRELEARRDREALAVPRGRQERIAEVKRRFDEELAFTHAANRCYEQWRAGAKDRRGRRLHGVGMKTYVPPLVAEGKINTTDPDSGVMIQRGQPPMQGYNAQAAVTTGQIVVGADVITTSGDYGQLGPVVDTALRDLRDAGVTDKPQTVLADAGFWHTQQMEAIIASGTQVLIPPDSGLRAGARPGWEGGYYAFMRRVLATDHGHALYSKRKDSIEPVFGQLKGNRRLDRFLRRGRGAVRSEWRLITATHNLLKLHSHWIAPATG
jgi:transposase